MLKVCIGIWEYGSSEETKNRRPKKVRRTPRKVKTLIDKGEESSARKLRAQLNVIVKAEYRRLQESIIKSTRRQLHGVWKTIWVWVIDDQQRVVIWIIKQ